MDDVFHTKQPLFTSDIIGTANRSMLFHVNCHDDIIKCLVSVIFVNSSALLGIL